MKEFKHGETVQVKNGITWSCRVYIGTCQDWHVTGDALGNVSKYKDSEIGKDSPSFEDVEIDWREVHSDLGVIPYCVSPWSKSEENVSGNPIGQIHRGWILVGYVFDTYSEFFDLPIIWDRDKCVTESKATHARFVKIN